MEQCNSNIELDAAAAAAAFIASEFGGDRPETPVEAPPAKLPPEPLDFFGDTSLTGRQDITRDMLPEVLWRYAEDAAARPGLNVASIAVGCIVAAAGAIRHGWVIQPKLRDTDWVEKPILWFGLTGQSGAKKTSAINAAVAPLAAIEKQVMEKAEDLWAQYRRDKALYNEEMKVWRADFKSMRKDGMSFAEVAQSLPKPEEPEKPTLPRMLADDTTIESLMKLCADNPDGIVQVRDELAEWLASFDLYSGGTGNRDRGKYLTAYNGQGATKDRASDEEGPMRVKSFAVSIMGGIQDKVLGERFKNDSRDGFLARFLLCRAERLEGVDKDPDYAAAQAYFETIFRLHSMVLPTGMDGDVSIAGEIKGVIKMSPGAAALREDIESISYHLSNNPLIVPALSDHLNKWPGMFARLCLVFHMLEAAVAKVEPAKEVSEETARRAFRLLTEFFLPEAARVYNEVMQGDETTQHAKWIAGHILAHGLEKVSVFDIKRAFSALDKDQRAIEQATQLLEMSAWITPDGKRSARYDFAKMKWRVNPRVHAMYADRAERERLDREDAKARIAKGAEAVRKLRKGGAK